MLHILSISSGHTWRYSETVKATFFSSVSFLRIVTFFQKRISELHLSSHQPESNHLSITKWTAGKKAGITKIDLNIQFGTPGVEKKKRLGHLARERSDGYLTNIGIIQQYTLRSGKWGKMDTIGKQQNLLGILLSEEIPPSH